ncbi:MAG: anti-sigma factor domain-containing protein [Acidimicrobiales bacterium]
MDRLVAHYELEDLLGAFVLDALDGDEAELVSRHLAACPQCRVEVIEGREVAGLLGYVGEEAPAGLWDRIAANLDEAPPAVVLERVPGTRGDASVESLARRWRVRVLAAAGASVAAAVILVLGLQVVRLDNRTTSLDVALSGPNMASVRLAMAQPGARQVALRPSAGGPVMADAVIEADGRGYLYGFALAPLPSDRTYQLWGVVGSERISYGVLTNAPGIQPIQIPRVVKVLAITEEAAGGTMYSSKAPVALAAIPSAT